MIKKITSGVLALLCIGVPLTNDLCSVHANGKIVENNQIIVSNKSTKSEKENDNSSLIKKLIYGFGGAILGLGTVLGIKYLFGNSSSNNNNTTNQQSNPSNNNGDTTNQQNNSPSSNNNATNKQDNSSSSDNNATNKQDNSSSSDNNAINKQDNSSSSDDNAINKQDNSSSSNDNATSKQDNSPGSNDNAINKQDNSSSGNDNTTNKQNSFSNRTNGPSIEQALPNDDKTTEKLVATFKHTYRNIDKLKIDPNKSEIFALRNGIGSELGDTIIDLPRSNKGGNKCEFVVESGRSFAVVRRLIDCGFIRSNDRIAVLNFANYYKPGGGVKRGCRAQEESLCRVSTLYAHLEKLWTPFYSVNQKVRNVEKNSLGGDRGIYTKGVVQLKEDTSLPGDRLIPKGQPKLIVDILTVAAPDLRRENELKNDPQRVRAMMINRIKLTVAMAIKNKVDTLVLGALGCGAFGVDPEICADAYYEVLVKEGYASYFKKIVFPILVVEGFKNDKNNYRVFAERFHGLTVK